MKNIQVVEQQDLWRTALLKDSMKSCITGRENSLNESPYLLCWFLKGISSGKDGFQGILSCHKSKICRDRQGGSQCCKQHCSIMIQATFLFYIHCTDALMSQRGKACASTWTLPFRCKHWDLLIVVLGGWCFAIFLGWEETMLSVKLFSSAVHLFWIGPFKKVLCRKSNVSNFVGRGWPCCSMPP